MPNHKMTADPASNRWVFTREFLRKPLQIGSIIPSSRFLEQRVVAASGVASADCIVELGSGTGGITRAILRAMPQQAKLLSIEINPLFHDLVSKIEDERLIAHLGSAGDLDKIVAQYDLGAPNAIISGIPFSTMSHDAGTQIIETLAALLAPEGCFVAYQVNNRVATLCRPVLGPEQATMEIFNIPPTRVYRWAKEGA